MIPDTLGMTGGSAVPAVGSGVVSAETVEKQTGECAGIDREWCGSASGFVRVLVDQVK